MHYIRAGVVSYSPCFFMKIMKVMNAAQDAEYKKLIVAGEPLTKKEQNELKENSDLNSEVKGE